MRTLPGAIAAVALPILTGCVTYTEYIRFNTDGSGTVSARLVAPKAALVASSTPGPFRVDQLLADLTREKLERKLDEEGITIRRIVIEENDTTRLWQVEYAFADLEAFRRVRNEGRDVALVRYDTGNYELDLVFSSADEGEQTARTEESDTAGNEEAETVTIAASDSLALDTLLKGFSATFVFEMPTAVLSAPRGRASGNTATFEWSYEREGVFVLQPRTMRVIFRKGDLKWPTFEAMPAPSGQPDVWDSDTN